jgi:polar amino acid transport system substrate-binding protein
MHEFMYGCTCDHISLFLCLPFLVMVKYVWRQQFFKAFNSRKNLMKPVVLILTLILSTRICFAENIRIEFATGEWPPFSSVKLPEYGRATALVSAICKAAGISPSYIFFPWKRAELKVAKGEIFAAFPYAISEERKELYDFSETLFFGVNLFMYYDQKTRTSSPITYNVLDDLRGYRIGAISGSFLGATFENAGLDYESTTSIDQSIHKLVAGRFNFCIDDRLVLYDAIQRLYPGAHQILEKFNRGLAIIKQNGEYDRIIQKYHMTK